MAKLSPIVTRRTVLAGAAVSAAAFALPPPAVTQDDGFTVIRARKGSSALRGPSAAPTPIWGFDGVTPGPLLRVRRGREIKVQVLSASLFKS